jgi:hypothetical protein
LFNFDAKELDICFSVFFDLVLILTTDWKYFLPSIFLFETERFSPFSGWQAPFLPTDRPHWADINGQHARAREDILLPSGAYQWEGAWRVDVSGTPHGPTDKQGLFLC